MLHFTTVLKATGVAVGALSLSLVGVAQAAPGGGGGGGGGKPDVPPGQDKDKGKPDNPGKGSGDLYGDLVLLHREPTSGLPILDDNECVQPISHNTNLDGTAIKVTDLYGYPAYLIPLIGGPEEETACDIVGSDTEDPSDDLSIYLEEVDFGRLNLGRSPEKVLTRLLADVSRTLTDENVGLDPAGRLTYADGVGTIDAPGANLAMHEQFQEMGVLYDTDGEEIVIAGGMLPLDHAGATLGAAADKTGQINVDLVVYNNRVLNIPEDADPNVLGTIVGGGGFGVPGELYVDYSAYSYHRSAMYDGCASGYVTVYDEYGEPQLVSIDGESVMDLVFGGADFDGTGVVAFATRGDDARAVIEYVHSNPLADLDPLGSTSCPSE